MQRRTSFTIASLLLLSSCLWVGIERYVGDHEIGKSWEPFLKSRPTFTLLFTNPAQQGLDRDAFDTLDAARQQAFQDYCAVRFGIADPHRCEKAIEGRRL